MHTIQNIIKLSKIKTVVFAILSATLLAFQIVLADQRDITTGWYWTELYQVYRVFRIVVLTGATIAIAWCCFQYVTSTGNDAAKAVKKGLLVVLATIAFFVLPSIIGIAQDVASKNAYDVSWKNGWVSIIESIQKMLPEREEGDNETAIYTRENENSYTGSGSQQHEDDDFSGRSGNY